MAQTISKETAQDLKNVVEMVKKIETDYKKCEPKYVKVEKDLQEAIDDQSEDELELFRPQMQKALQDVDSCIHSIDGALALLRNLRKDEALMEAKTDQINLLVKGLVNKQQILAKHAADGREMILEKAEKALKEAKNSATTIETELSDLKNSVKQSEDAVRYIEGQGAIFDKQTLAAQKAGDAKLMSDSRVKFLKLDYAKFKISMQGMKAKAEKFLPRIKDSKQRAEAQWALDTLNDLIDRCGTMSKRGQELTLLKIVAAPAPAPKPPAKLNNSQILMIAKHFPIDVKDGKLVSKFTKILNDNAHGEWPQKLIKEFGWKKPEVDAAMKKVNQLPFVKPLYLIDI